MIPDIVLELSFEQLISALDKKLTIECTKAQSKMAPDVTTMAAEIYTLEKRVKEILHGVTCLRNPLQPANRLPPEILALCASFVSRTKPKPIVSLTHVCRYWRRAIISYPGNWMSIPGDWNELVPLFLERSGAAPLTVDITAWVVERDKDLAQALLPHLPRISKLSLCGYSFTEDPVENVLPNFFASPMPNLTSLKVELDEDSANPTNLFPPKAVRAPQLFQNVSKLKSRHLTEIPLYPMLYDIEPLVELTLVSYTFHFQEFIGFLRSNRNLEILDLQEISFTGIPASPAPIRWVHFPRLRRLALDCGGAINTRALLSSLSLPRGVNIEVRQTVEDPYDLASFLPRPSTHIQDLLVPITTIKHLPSLGKLYLSGNNGSLSFDGPKLSYTDYEELDQFATGTVREFHLAVTNQSYRLPQVLEQLPALEALVISQGCVSPEFLSVLAMEPVLCPSLNTIAFLDCEVTRAAADQLEEILAKRANSTAARLHRIVIVNHTQDLPDRSLVSQLRNLVPRVDVIMGDQLPDLL